MMVEKIKKLKYSKKLLFPVAALMVAAILLLSVHILTVGTVNGRRITAFDIRKLNGAPSDVSNFEKSQLIADGFLYEEILKDGDPTFNQVKVRAYMDLNFSKVHPDQTGSMYYRQQYFTNELKSRVERYIKGGFIADYIALRYDQNFDSKNFTKITNDLQHALIVKNEIINGVNDKKMTFKELTNKIRADKKFGSFSTKGVFSSLGPSDVSHEQVEVWTAYSKTRPLQLPSDIALVEVFKNAENFKLPAATIVYQPKKNFKFQSIDLKSYLKQQQQKYGYKLDA
jgi:hypothetical protein